MKVHTILPGLYQRGRTDGLGLAEKVAGCRELGITGAVNLYSKADGELAGVVEYWHIPIADGELVGETAAMLDGVARMIKHSMSRGGGWMVQCRAGRNRSGLLSALVVRQVLGLNGEMALELVRQRRPRAVANPHFEAYLASLGEP